MKIMFTQHTDRYLHFQCSASLMKLALLKLLCHPRQEESAVLIPKMVWVSKLIETTPVIPVLVRDT